MLAIIGGGAVGLVDDWIKVVAARNLGLNKRAKMLGLLIVGVGFAFLVTQYTNVPTTLSFTRFDNPGWDLGRIGWMVWALLLITATTNAVNLTDGLDGLAAGAGRSALPPSPSSGSGNSATPTSTTTPTPLTSLSWLLRWSAASSAFCGGTPRPPRFSWVTQGRSRSEVASPRSPSRPVRISCCRSSVVSS